MASILLMIVIVLGIVLGIGYLAYEGEQNPVKSFQDEANQLLETFPDGSSIAFIKDPTAPITEFIWEEKQTTKTVTLDNGTVINQTSTELVKVQTSELELGITDKQTGIKKIVKQGHQTFIEGQITLVDTLGNKVQPPYGYTIIITCDFRDTCATFPVVANGQLTDGIGGFKYSWTTTSKDTLGEYHAEVSISSKTLDSSGRYTSYTATRILELIV